MHCHVLPVGPFTEKTFRREVVKKKFKKKIYTHKILLFFWNLILAP